MIEGDPALGRASRVKRWYVEAAVHTFNILALLVVVNLACAAWMRFRTAPPGGYNPSRFPRDRLAAAYGDMPMDVVMGTLDETWNLMKLEAKPWVHYGEAKIEGKYVNVSRDGVRANGPREAQRGKPFRVFAFGGSTMWGYGVPDGETIAAHLERALAKRHPDRAIEVKNYGRGYYASSQELALFVSLLRRGEKPDAVVFLDGLNEVTSAFSEGDEPTLDRPAKMLDLESMWRQRDAPDRRVLPAWMPLAQMIDRIKSRATRAPAPPPAADAEAHATEDAEAIFRIYAINRRLVEHAAKDAGAAAHFFWQPIPEHAYDAKKRLFPGLFGPRAVAAMRALYRAFPGREPSVVDLSEMLATYPVPAYVDAHHYAPAVCKLIAERMAERVSVAP